MKLLKLTTTLLTLVTVNASIFGSHYSSKAVSKWDTEDLKQFLKDNSVDFNPQATLNELKELSNKQWKKAKQPWYYPENLKQQVIGVYNSAVGNDRSAPGDIKDWVFASWSNSDIERLLKESKIKYKADSTRSQLIKLAHDRYDDIAKAHKASGNYIGDWLYSSWDENSLKKWLKEYEVDFDPNAKKEDLSKLVRQYAYDASQYVEDQRQSVLDTLDLADKSLYDKAGSIRNDVFNTWRTSQLYNWLKANKVEVEDSIKDNKEELALLAQKYKDDLKYDVESWSTKVSKKVTPILSKSSERADNLINDTFFVGVEKWSKDRLKAFLTSRDVAVPLFATRAHLVKLVKENKYKPIKNFDSDAFLQGWSPENILKWSGVKKDVEDFKTKASDLYKQLVSNLEFYTNRVTNAADNAAAQVANKGGEAKDSFFDYWSDVELREYLSSFGIYNTKSYRRSDLLNAVKQHTKWFLSGSNYDSNSITSTAKYHTTNFYNFALYKVKTWYNYLYHLVF